MLAVGDAEVVRGAGQMYRHRKALPVQGQGLGDRSADEGEFARAVTSLIEYSGIGLAVLDPGSRIREANEAFCRRFDSDLRDLLEREFTGMLHPGCRGRLLRELAPLTWGHAQMTQHPIPVWTGEMDFVGELTGIAMEGEIRLGCKRDVVVLLKPDATRRSHSSVSSHNILTDLDARILEGVAAGKSTANLAAKLHFSRQGIEYHIKAMFRRFNVSNRTALACKAYAMGLLSESSWPPQVPSGYRRSA